MPKDELYDTQFELGESRVTSMPCALINDIALYFNDGAPLYISVVWTLKSVLTRYGMTPYCTNFGKSFHYTTGFLCIDGTII